MATDPQSLLSSGNCYACYGASTFEIMKLSLLAQISKAHNASNATDPASLIAQGKCYPCYGNVSMSKLMELALLAQIAS